jgi:hypothetical protein
MRNTRTRLSPPVFWHLYLDLYTGRPLVAYSSRGSTEELVSKCAGAYRRTRAKTKAESPVAAAAKSERSNVSAVIGDEIV